MATQRIAYVARVKHGREPECREVQQHMPVGGMKRLGITCMDAFVGSGFYLLVFEFHDHGQDFQSFFQRFSSDPGMRGFFDKLAPYVEGLPGPNFSPADQFHAVGRGSPGGETSAKLPLAAHSYHWTMDMTGAPA